jgi:hypothetical protein
MRICRLSRSLPVVSIGLLFALFSFGVPADSRRIPTGQAYEYDPTLDQGKEWKESAVTLPAFPQDSDLIAVPLPPRDTLKLYIDTKSVSRANDGIARFTLVVETTTGVRNVFYDGIRCETREYKTYALGTAEASLTAVKKPQWQKIPYYETNAYRFSLYKYFVCSDTNTARPPDELIRAIRYPAPSN